MSAETTDVDADDEADEFALDPLADFVHRVSIWHSDKVASLRTIQEVVKAGTTLKVGDDDDIGRVMTGRDAAMFKCGVEAALAELGTLPFTVSKVADGDDDVDSANAIAQNVCQAVSELPDRNSPSDWPEAMLVTSSELQGIVREAIFSERNRGD